MKHLKPRLRWSAFIAVVTLTIVLCESLLAHTAQAQPSSAPSVFNWFDSGRAPTQVNAHLWRSGRPDPATLVSLSAHGVHIIVDLEDDAEAVAAEATLARKMGFQFYSFPINTVLGPDDLTVNQILRLIATAKASVLVHCLHGEDRTGLVIGLERTLVEKWLVAKAYQEMLDNGFHEFFPGLTLYFERRTSSLL